MKRIARVWIPFAAAIALSVILLATVGNAPVAGTSWWFEATWRTPLNIYNIANTFAMTGNETSLDNPMWSLIHEIRIALLLPLIMIVVQKSRCWSAVLACLICLASTVLLSQFHYADVVSFADTITYTFPFFLGVLIASKRNALMQFLGKRTRAALITFGGAALVGLAWTPSETPPLTTIFPTLRFMVNAGAAALIIIVCLRSSGILHRTLNSATPMFLGKISYSLYLVHVPVLVATVRLLSSFIGIPLSIAAGVLASLAVAIAFQRFIEVPSARFGRALSRAVVTTGYVAKSAPLSGQTPATA